MVQTVRSWWDVFRSSPSNEMVTLFRSEHLNAKITTFTQMAWATTRSLGCSIVKCSSNYVVVCRYSPRGNILSAAIYEPGPTCWSCSAGCEANLGLCQ
ncbi:unnamed protein product [Strongylus vulgaris]|uniref:SCP domain-containing protein n=1 Tax=Strongylus vulgaris TaxID=40348 RepID=A0A3P7KUM6_STRVU|nr:unnamed protein product [Strongylus vulgaris]